MEVGKMLQAIEESATGSQKKYPNGVAKFLAAAQLGQPDIREFIQRVGISAYQAGGTNLIAQIFADFSSTDPALVAVQKLTRASLDKGCEMSSLIAMAGQFGTEIRRIVGKSGTATKPGNSQTPTAQGLQSPIRGTGSAPKP